MHIAAAALEPGRITIPACSPGHSKGCRARRIITTGIHASRDVPHVLCIKKRRHEAGVGNNLADQLNSRTR